MKSAYLYAALTENLLFLHAGVFIGRETLPQHYVFLGELSELPSSAGRFHFGALTAASAQVRSGLGAWGVPSPTSPASCTWVGVYTPGMGRDEMGWDPGALGLQDTPDDGDCPQGTIWADITGANPKHLDIWELCHNFPAGEKFHLF